MRRVLWLPGILLALLACAGENALDSLALQENRYSYSGYDSTGVKIVQGWIEFQTTDSSTVVGQWELSPVGNPQQIGPQTGSGELSGGQVDGRIYMDLNPTYRDNNVVLEADYNREKLDGEWSYIGFPGVLNRGSFKAVRER
ncbi:MAG: hypothetical protein ACOY90_13340 [Candidatus Zhuqueibacterota bacterium]